MSQKIPDAPITRSEMYDAREIELLEQIAEGGLGPSVTVEALSVTANGTYSEQGKAYSPVTVAVPEPVLDPLEVTQNGTYTPVHDGYSEVTVNVPTGGGGGEPTRDVNFYDYDGTILYSYSAAGFLALSAMPANPSHDGLTAQGWNWSFADAQDYVSKYGMLEIGQMYITDDGKTRIYIHLEEGRLSPKLGLGINGSVYVDWGDGSAHSLVEGTALGTTKLTDHTYAKSGDYVIVITVDGEVRIPGDSSYGSRLLTSEAAGRGVSNAYRQAIQKIHVGNNVDFSGYNSFYLCGQLKSITLPYGTENVYMRQFGGCSSLHYLTVPQGVTEIGPYAFEKNSNFSCGLSRISLPSSLTNILSSAFVSLSTLRKITIPENVIALNTSAFSSCISLTSFVVPSGVQTIGGTTLAYLSTLGSLRFLSAVPPTVSASSAFQSLPTDCIIYVPTGTLEDYTTATNYPSSSTYTYVEY